MASTLIHFLAFSIIIATFVALLVINHRNLKNLKVARSYNEDLLQVNASKDFHISLYKASRNDALRECAELKAQVEQLRNAAKVLVKVGFQQAQELRKAEAQIEFLKDCPLFYVSDEELPEAIKWELEVRFSNAVNKSHKLASKVGGKAFRVVDSIKRGKLV